MSKVLDKFGLIDSESSQKNNCRKRKRFLLRVRKDRNVWRAIIDNVLKIYGSHRQRELIKLK